MKIQILWTLIFLLHLILDNVYGNSSEFDLLQDNWRKECIYDFYATMKIKSIGILYKEEASSKYTNIIKCIANKGVSSSVFECSFDNAHDLMKIIYAWKAQGVHHILFLQRMSKHLLHLWSQILGELCDDTWWLFYAQESSRNLFEKALTNSRCQTDRWIVYCANCSTCEQYNTTFVTKLDSNKIQSLSSYHSADKVFENISVDDSRRLVRLAVNESPPYLALMSDENGSVVLKDGPDAKILQMIAEKLRFKYEIVLSPDGEWGRIKRGNWTGLMGMLTRNEADIAAGCITITHQRYGVALFSIPYDVQRSTIISRIPSIKAKTYAVLSPFRYDVWLMVFFILMVFLLLLYGFGKAYDILYLRKPYKLDRIFWYMMGTICSEGGWLTFEIQGTATVLLLGLWLLFVIVMQASYCGTLMSVLTFPAYEPSIDTLPDLARAVVEEGYKCGCLKGTINCDTLMDLSGDLEVIQKALNSDKRNFVHSVQEGLSKVLEENYVFVAQEIASIYEAQLMPEPNFFMSGESLDIELFSFAIRRGLPYRIEISNIILRLLEAGLITKWRDDIISINNMKFARRKREVPEIYPLSLTQLTGAIYMFAYGMLLAATAFVFEYIKGKCFNKSKI